MNAIKLGIILAIIAALIGGYQWHITRVEEAGYNKAKAEYAEALTKQLAAREAENQKMLVKLKDDLSASQKSAKLKASKAIALQKKLDNRPTVEIIREINTLDSDCTALGAKYGLLYNKIIGDAPIITTKQ